MYCTYSKTYLDPEIFLVLNDFPSTYYTHITIYNTCSISLVARALHGQHKDVVSTPNNAGFVQVLETLEKCFR